MNKFKKWKWWYWIPGLIVLVFVVPNVFNAKEKDAFSDERRLQMAKALTSEIRTDSIVIVPGAYYKRSSFYEWFLGKRNRDLWTTPISVKVFDYDTTKGGLVPFEQGGSQQTISIRLTDSLNRVWVLRSVNKDQQNALPPFLRHTFLRSLFRDQASAMNPYGQMVVSVLSDSAGLAHTNPELYWMPHQEQYGSYNKRMSGRLVYLEEQQGDSWLSFINSYGAERIYSTEEMFRIHDSAKVPIDSMLFLKSRLFDMLIGDWDRHEAQWKWALCNTTSGRIFKPIAKDRDMALFVFDEGLLSKITLLFNPKFQSFRPRINNVKGLMWQAKQLDKMILTNVPETAFRAVAEEIMQKVSLNAISKAFKTYRFRTIFRCQ